MEDDVKEPVGQRRGVAERGVLVSMARRSGKGDFAQEFPADIIGQTDTEVVPEALGSASEPGGPSHVVGECPGRGRRKERFQREGCLVKVFYVRR